MDIMYKTLENRVFCIVALGRQKPWRSLG